MGYSDSFWQGFTDSRTSARQARLDAISLEQAKAQRALKQAAEARLAGSAKNLADFHQGTLENAGTKIRDAAQQRIIDNALGPAKDVLKDPEVASQVAGLMTPV